MYKFSQEGATVSAGCVYMIRGDDDESLCTQTRTHTQTTTDRTTNLIIKCKILNITNRKRLQWRELINPYNFFIISVFHHRTTSRKTSRRDIEAPESLESFKVSASVSEVATSRLGPNFERLGLVLVSAQKVSCTSLPLYTF